MQEVFEKILERLEELAKSDEIRALKTEEDEKTSLITALQYLRGRRKRVQEVALRPQENRQSVWHGGS